MSQWWRDAVVYQVYPRSFQDSDGDGIGDLDGIRSRLDHLTWLGVDAIWLSPIYPSPGADLGYDVSDYCDVDPLFGDLDRFEALVRACREREIRVLMDLVPSHTSIEHPWFRAHPDWYTWADDAPPNNWRAAFGGSAWSRDPRSGRWYLHSHYPEQPDLDWRNPQVREAFAEVVRFWVERGVDGFRIDAVQVLVKDAELRDDGPATEPFPLPLHGEVAALDGARSRNNPEVGMALAAIREAAGDAFLVGEAYVPTASLGPYLDHLDLAFAFEFLHGRWEAAALRPVLAAGAKLGQLAWVLSNHDFSRLGSRLGGDAVRAAAVLLLTLPGAVFVYQGDEIGMVDDPGSEPRWDRYGRDRFRHPMQWTPEPLGGFTGATPWLGLTDPGIRNVAVQRDDPDSLLSLYRRLIALRHELRGGLRLVDSAADVLAFRRGRHLVSVNLGEHPAPAPAGGHLLLTTTPGDGDGDLDPGEGRVVRCGGV